MDYHDNKSKLSSSRLYLLFQLSYYLNILTQNPPDQQYSLDNAAPFIIAMNTEIAISFMQYLCLSQLHDIYFNMVKVAM